jgi:condensin complex subunit 3
VRTIPHLQVRPILGDVTKEEKQRDRTLSRRFTLNVKRRAKENADDDEVGEDDEEDQDDDVDTEPVEERLKTTYLRLCILNEVLEAVDWVRPRAYASIIVTFLHLVS